MQIDNTTYKDLLLFSNDEEYSIFHRLDFTRTIGGKARLASIFTEPFSEIRKILQVQAIIRLILAKENEWPLQITNGTVMVMEKFLKFLSMISRTILILSRVFCIKSLARPLLGDALFSTHFLIFYGA
jgi:DNA mismatch repair ATPase MutS